MYIQELQDNKETDLEMVNGMLDIIVNVTISVRELLLLAGLLNGGYDDDVEHIRMFMKYLYHANGKDWCNDTFGIDCSSEDDFCQYTTEVLNKLKINDNMIYQMWDVMDRGLTRLGVVYE